MGTYLLTFVMQKDFATPALICAFAPTTPSVGIKVIKGDLITNMGGNNFGFERS